MIKLINQLKLMLVGTAEKKRLIENILSLGMIQGLSYLLPLATVPYLVRTLGPEYFGLLAFATATTTYLMIITDYGFNLSATRQISIYRENKIKINEIFSSIIIIKLILMTISGCLMLFLIFGFEKFTKDWKVYSMAFGSVIGQALFPIWYFQGIERIRRVIYLNIGSRIFFTGCIFLFVKEKTDYLLVPLLTSMGTIVSGLWALHIANKEFGIKISWQKIPILRSQLIDGWHVFFSSIAISLYTTSTVVILGLFAGNTTVGYFSAADKIVHAVKGMYVPIAQAIYPHISKTLSENKQKGLLFIRGVIWMVGFGSFVASAFLFMFAEEVVNLLLGHQYQASISILKIMAFLPAIVALSNIFGIQTMLNLGYKKEFAFFVVIAAILGICLALILTNFYKEIGLAISIVIVEVIVTTMLGLFLLLKILKGTL